MIFSEFSWKTVLLLILSLHLLTSSFALSDLSVRQDDDCQINSICFVMDQSGSIGGNYPEEQRFVVEVTTELATRITDTMYSAYGFSDGPVLIQSSTKDLEGTFIPAINVPVTPIGGTDMAAGLNACFNEIKDQAGNRVIVLITDGEDNGTPLAETVAPTIKSSGVAIVTVGIGSSVDEDYLQGIASDPSLFIPSAFSSLPGDVIKVADSSCVAAMVTPAPLVDVTPIPTFEDDICEEAYQRCVFRFRGRPTVPTFRLRNKSDSPFTPRIVSQKSGVRVGVLNMNNVIPEFINNDGSVQQITKDADASPRFTPTHFKPYSLKKSKGSGIGHQVFTGNQKLIARGRCIRVFFTHYQVLTNSKPRNVMDNMVAFSRSKNKCVVFKTR